jgi:hypothetical protein
MKTEEIKRDIKDQIVKTNRSFGKLGRSGVIDPSLEDIDSLEKKLTIIMVYFKIYLIGTIILSGLLFAVSFLKSFEMLNSIDLNKYVLFIIFVIVFEINTLAYYKLKVKYENKIYLLKLLNKFD